MKKTMKTIGTIMLIAALVFTFAACSNGGGGGGGGNPTPPKVSDFYGTWKHANGDTRIISSDELRFYNSDTDDMTYSLDTATPVTNDNPATKTDYPYGFKFEGKVKAGTEPRLTAMGGIGADWDYVMFMHTNKKSYSGLGESGNNYFKQ